MLSNAAIPRDGSELSRSHQPHPTWSAQPMRTEEAHKEQDINGFTLAERGLASRQAYRAENKNDERGTGYHPSANGIEADISDYVSRYPSTAISDDEVLPPGASRDSLTEGLGWLNIEDLPDTESDAWEDNPWMSVVKGVLHLLRFEESGMAEDWGQALHYMTRGAVLTHGSKTLKTELLGGLGGFCLAGFMRDHQLTDLEKAIKFLGQALLDTPDGNPGKVDWLIALGVSYQLRFEHRGDVADVSKAIDHYSQALQLTPDCHASRPRLLTCLGNLYVNRFLCHGELADVDRAIECHSQAALLTPDSHEDKPCQLGNLGVAFHCRYGRQGELADLDKSIECCYGTMMLTPNGFGRTATVLINLGSSYQDRFRHLNQIEDINEAINCLSQALLVTPDGHENRQGVLYNLGNSYVGRYEAGGDLAEIAKGIEFLSQALLVTPADHQKKPACLSDLGNAHLLRFRRCGELEDINCAIDYATRAVQIALDDHADKTSQLYNLGSSYVFRYLRYGLHSDGAIAIEYFRQAVRLVSGHRGTQFRAARYWAATSLLLGISPRDAYHAAMQLVPELVWLGTTVDQRYLRVLEIRDIAREAASCAISENEYNNALEWLEQGRSIVWNQILQLRDPFEDLSATNPALAERLRELASELECAGNRSIPPSSPTDGPWSTERDTQRHHRLAGEWKRLLEKVRSLPGNANFMRPRTASELMGAAKDGPVIVLNVHEHRCDALVLQPGAIDIAHVSLQTFSKDKAVNAYEQLAALIGRQGIRSRGFKPVGHRLELRKILAMLWSDVAKPILDFLGYKRKLPVDELPHVTWCTTGALSSLPLHAAGCYDGLQPNVPDLVVSSYAPTLNALLVPVSPAPGLDDGLLTVGQSEYSNGLCNLPSTVDELETVKKHAGLVRHMQLDGNNATVDAVLNAMDQYSWVHLACHAAQNTTNPAQSAFHLRDGNLTLEAITKRSFKNKGLAFLSACQTAAGDDQRPDEALHLAAGMLMAGYPSVIATMWSIYDVDGPEVAEQVYSELLKNGKVDCTGASRALHKAIMRLRGKVGLDSFERWVPFIHMGV